MSIVAIIPARGGSKAVPRKNIIDFCGAPLISWSIENAKNCKKIDSIYVSTEDQEIAQVSSSYGAKIVHRPVEIAGDFASSEMALIDACDQIMASTGKEPEVVVFIQCTSPLRETKELDQALDLFFDKKLDSLFCAAEPEDTLCWIENDGGENLTSVNYDWKNRKMRQVAGGHKTLLIETGSFYITRTNILREHNNRFGGKIGVYKTDFWKAYEIDSFAGLDFCQLLMKHYGLDKNSPKKIV